MSFDRKGNFFLLESQHDTGITNGTILLTQYSFSGGTPSFVAIHTVGGPGTPGFNPNDPGITFNQSFLPTGAMAFQFPGTFDVSLAVDDNVTTFTDPQTPRTQSDPFSGNIYVSATRDTPAPPGAVNWNPYTTDLWASADGGVTWTNRAISTNHNILGHEYGSSKVAVSQQAYDANGNVTVVGGQVDVIYDDFVVAEKRRPAPHGNPLRDAVAGGQRGHDADEE